MHNDKHIKQQEVILVGLLLSFAIVVFNYYDIFVLKTLYMDDHHRLLLGHENQIHNGIFQRNSLRAYVIWPLYKLLSINIVYARLMQTLVFYIPLALVFYLLYRNYAGIARWPAVAASLLPAILPGQNMIPSFIDGSYTIQGLLVFLLALFTAFRFLNLTGFSILWFILAGIAYAASIEMMDQAIFMAPVMVVFCFLLFPSTPYRKKLISISFLVITLAILKATYQSLHPATASAVAVTFNWDLFISRLQLLPTYTLPFSHKLDGRPIDASMLWLIYGSTLFAGLVCGNKKHRKLIICGLLWAFFAIITFLTISRGFAPRLSHISAWGLVFSLVISIIGILHRLPAKQLSIPFVLCGLILWSGYTRLEAMKIFVAPRNQVQMAAEQLYASVSWPTNAQVMLINVPPWVAGGWWPYSKGYFKLLTGRDDLTGVVGWEKYLYNPLTPMNRGFKPAANMAGIGLDKPIFIYRLTRKIPYHFVPVSFFLKWQDLEWSIYSLNKTGEHQILGSGKGNNSLQDELKKHKLANKNLAFYGANK